MKSPGIVIVGAGQSAAVAAYSLREQGYQGRITMLGRERHRPYERPPLSKAVLMATPEPPLDVFTEEFWTHSNIHLLSCSDVTAIDLPQQYVRLGSGEMLQYEMCLIATGGEASTLQSIPPATPNVHYIRTIDDARRLRAALQAQPRVAIIGGGFLGLEIANSALATGASVTVIERATSLLDRFLPPEASEWLECEMCDAGVQLLLGISLHHAQSLSNGCTRLTTNVGDLEFDEVVVAIGLTPNDSLARDASLDIATGGGILVDAFCRTKNEHVFACGDCTSQLRSGQTAPTRLESWQNANEQARTAAAAMLGIRRSTPKVPWFWTDQGKHNIQMLGLPAPDLKYVRRGDPANDKVLWIGHRNSVPIHGVAINAGSDLRAIRPLFDRGQPVPLEGFDLHATNLRTWVKQLQTDPTTTD